MANSQVSFKPKRITNLYKADKLNYLALVCM